LSSVSQSLLQFKDAIPDLPEAQRASYLEQASLFYQAAGNVVLASADTPLVLSYMNTGVKLARLSENIDLLSTALGRRAAALYELGEQERAEKSIREALAVAPKKEQVFRYPVASRVLSVTASDKQDRQDIYRMLDSLTPNDRYNTGLASNIILWCRAQCLINMAQNAPNRSVLLRQAENLLDRAEASAPDTPRRWLIIKLAQARAALGLREYDLAATLAVEAFSLMKQLKSALYLPQFIEIYDTLQCSSYTSSPQVKRLGLLLSGITV
jgi:hypothetical protein